ncbi:hypothetical protein D3C71_1760960 [compost metagenome]
MPDVRKVEDLARILRPRHHAEFSSLGIKRNDELLVLVAKDQLAIDTGFRKGRAKPLIVFAKLRQQRVMPLLLTVDCPGNQSDDGYDDGD